MGENKQVMIVGMDESDHSFYALEWTLDHFFSNGGCTNFKLVVVHAKICAASIIGLAGQGTYDVIPLVEADLKKTAEKVVERINELCSTKSVKDAHVEVIEGDARDVMCKAVEKYHADVLVLGSHGYGAFKRAVLGSVSDYCTHHARCSVMIVKKPKIKH